MEQKQYISALQMYKNCMGKFARFNDVQHLLYIARAYWKAGKLIECRDYVEQVRNSQFCVHRIFQLQALLEAPDNLIIRFNHSIVLQKLATNVLKEEKATSIEVSNAIECLKIAEK
jgi:RNA polymerase-associated protein CTR9